MPKPKYGEKRYSFDKVNQENKDLLYLFRRSCIGKKLSENTTYTYCKDIYGYLQYLESKDIITIESTTEDFLDYIAINDEKVGAKRILKIITSNNKFFEFLRERKRVIKINPITAVDTSKWRAILNAEKIIKGD